MTAAEVLSAALKLPLADGAREGGYVTRGGGLVVALKEAAGDDVEAYNRAYEAVVRVTGARDGDGQEPALRCWAKNETPATRKEALKRALAEVSR